jgi:hypothetical protein
MSRTPEPVISIEKVVCKSAKLSDPFEEIYGVNLESTAATDEYTYSIVTKTDKIKFFHETDSANEFQSVYDNMVSIGKEGRAKLSFNLATNTSKSEYKPTFFSKFFTEAISFSTNERTQITETLTNYVVSFRGSPPMTLDIRGSLLNDTTHEWLSQFMSFYETYRATAASQKDNLLNREVTLEFENFRFTGYLIAFGVAIDSINNPRVPFNLSMLVKNKDIPAIPLTTTSIVATPNPNAKRMQDGSSITPL